MQPVNIGRICKRYRQMVLRKSARAVAIATGYSTQTVYAFEQGRNHNYVFLLWYLSQGLTIDELLEG